MEQELAIKLQNKGIPCLTQVVIPVTTTDFYFPTETRPLLVFIDGPGPSRKISDDQGRRAAFAATEEGIQGPRIMLPWLLRREKRPALPRNPRKLRKTIVSVRESLRDTELRLKRIRGLCRFIYRQLRMNPKKLVSNYDSNLMYRGPSLLYFLLICGTRAGRLRLSILDGLRG